MEKKHITAAARLHKLYVTDSYALPNGMDHFALLRLIKRNARYIGLCDSQLRQYELMIAHSQSVDWQEGNQCIFWMSVEKMAIELDKSVRQVQYNNDRLVALGLISMRLSGNYRRGGERGDNGAIKWASGVDLKPVIEKIAEFQAIDQRIAERKTLIRDTSKKISALRRLIRSVIEYQWPEFADLAMEIINIRPRLTWTMDRLNNLHGKLQALWQQIEEKFSNESDVEEEHLDAIHCSHGCNGLRPPIQDTTQDKDFCIETASGLMPLPVKMVARGDTPHAAILPPNGRGKEKTTRVSGAVSIGQLLHIAQEQNPYTAFAEDTPDTTNTSQLYRHAELAAVTLGISPHALTEAQRYMGMFQAAIAVLTIEIRSDDIGSPGGYLRGMTKRAKSGQLYLEKTAKNIIKKYT